MKTTFNNWYEQKMRSTKALSSETDFVADLLRAVKTVAIVGISRNPHKDSNYVGRYLKNAGYTVVPVNPGGEQILGLTTYSSLSEIPFSVDVVDIFRKPEDVPSVVEEALDIHPKAIWLQLGTGTHNEIAKKVEAGGITFVQNRCIKVDHQFLIRQ